MIEGQHRIAAAELELEIALAADGDVQRVLAEGGGRDIDRRRDVFQILDGLDVQLVEIVLVEAVMEIGTACASSARLRAVTITVSSPVAEARLGRRSAPRTARGPHPATRPRPPRPRKIVRTAFPAL